MSLLESLFPLKVVDCAQAATTKNSANSDARTDYHCARSSSVLWPITTTHLLIMVCVFFVATLLYTVLLRIRARQANAHRRQLPVVSMQATVARSGSSKPVDALYIDSAAAARVATSWQRYTHGR